MRGYLVHHLLERNAQTRPGAILSVDSQCTTTYGETEAGANRLAHALADQGVRRGDRVVLIAANSSAYIEGYYGILKAGAVVVSLNAQADPRTHAGVVEDCRPAGLVCGPREVRQARVIAEAGGLAFSISVGSRFPEGAPGSTRLLSGPDVLSAFSSEPPGARLVDLDRAAIVYTSGSTGKPRGAILLHLNVVANTRSIVEYLGLGRDDRVLVVLPYHYVYGKSLLNTHVAVGGSVVHENRFMFPQTALDSMENHEATGFAGVPSTFAILLNKSNIAERSLPSLRYVTQAGGAMAPDLQRRLIAALPGKRIVIMYGATEASARLSYLPPEDLPRKIGSIGFAIPNVDLRVLREDGSECDVEEVGEIVARGANIMEGYWNAPGETAEVLDEHGYHTGDLGRRDEEGYLYVVGRSREMIKSGAHRISPMEIEEALAGHDSVHEVAVVGVPDEMLGEAIAAFLTLRPGCEETIEGVREWSATRLPAHKIPNVVEFLSEMPRNASGKIDKLALGARARER